MRQSTENFPETEKGYHLLADGADTPPPVLPLEGLIRIDTVLVHYQISKAQLYQEISEGAFPRQIKIGRSSFWDAKEFRIFLKGHGAKVSVPIDPLSPTR